MRLSIVIFIWGILVQSAELKSKSSIDESALIDRAQLFMPRHRDEVGLSLKSLSKKHGIHFQILSDGFKKPILPSQVATNTIQIGVWARELNSERPMVEIEYKVGPGIDLAGKFTEKDTRELVQVLYSYFRQGLFDYGLVEGLQLIQNRLELNQIGSPRFQLKPNPVLWTLFGVIFIFLSWILIRGRSDLFNLWLKERVER